MDNASGHGMEQAVQQYTTDLLAGHNVEISHQAARSPETNALDLGLWQSIQPWVEEQQFSKTTIADALSRSALEAWQNLPIATISSIFWWVPGVLQLLVDDNGGNNLVQERRGRRSHAPEQQRKG